MVFMKSLAIVAIYGLAAAVKAVELSGHTKQMFDESMSFLDNIYDANAGYLRYFYFPLAAGQHETRSSAWYATGLLQRNEGDDVTQACKIIRNIIDGQHKEEGTMWYGDYQVYPEEPTVGTDAYPPTTYGSWDPNWRVFIGTNLIVIYEEFQHLLPSDLQDLIVESLVNSTLGDTARPDGIVYGALNPSYTNPSVMRAVQASWTGRKSGKQNLTDFGESWARDVVELFDEYETLSEFNSGTYAGVSIYALTMWAKYMPDDSVLKKNGERMLRLVWEQLSQTWNANMRNLAGPWDRTYGYDMNQYYAIIATYVWSFVGKQHAPVYSQAWSMAHADDFEYTPLIAVLAPFHNSLIPNLTVDAFVTFPGDHLYQAQTYSPPGDAAVRNITTWNSEKLTIGVESFRDSPRAASHTDQWNPAVVQWLRERDDSVGYISLYSTGEPAMQADVDENGWLNLTYTEGRPDSIFSFVVSENPLGGKRDLSSLADIEGVNVTVSGTVDLTPSITFCGLVGGDCDPIHNFEVWNFTYSMPEWSSELPQINMQIKLTE